MSPNRRIAAWMLFAGIGTCAIASAAPPAAAATAASAAETPRQRHCEILVTNYWNAQDMQLAYGSLATREDADKRTTQVIIVAGLATGQSKIADHGQIIYTSQGAVSDGPTLTGLLQQAIVQRIAADTSLDCHDEASF